MIVESLYLGKHDCYHLPKKAGDAKLIYCQEVEKPFRNGSDIFIPDSHYWSLRQIQGESLIQIVGNDGVRNHLYFGGTDESPFLSHMNPTLQRIESGNEFLNQLRPPIINILQKRWRLDFLRQGDWFALPVPDEYKIETGSGMARLFSTLLNALGKLNLLNLKFDADDADIVQDQGGTQYLNKTRHRIEKGELLEVLPGYYVARGILQAPDHLDRKLDGFHFLAQAVGFYDEKTREKAD